MQIDRFGCVYVDYWYYASDLPADFYYGFIDIKVHQEQCDSHESRLAVMIWAAPVSDILWGITFCGHKPVNQYWYNKPYNICIHKDMMIP